MTESRGSIAALFFVSAVLHSAAVAQGLRISDFRLPESFFQRLNLFFNGGVSRNGTESSERSGNNSYDQGSAIFQYILHESGETVVMNLRPSLSASYSFSEDSRRDSIVVRSSTNQANSLQVEFPWQGSWYFKPDTWYVYSSALAEAFTAFSQYEFPGFGEPTNRGESKRFGYHATAGAGVGFGKVREGQSVFAILRVMDRLREEELLLREADREEILKLARLYSRRSQYLSLFERPEKYFFGDMFETLDSLGIIDRGKLNAYAILKVTDVRLESIVPRPFGWRIQAGLEHSSYQTTRTSSQSRYFDRGSLDFLVVLAEYGYDVSVQTDAYANFSTKVVVTPRMPEEWTVEATCRLSHELGDRIESDLLYFFTEKEGPGIFPGPETMRNVSHSVSARISFFLEDRAALSASVYYGQARRVDYFSGQAHRSVSAGASFGLTYRLF